MKQFSAILNIVLLVAVAVLYFLHFKSNKKTPAVKSTVAAVKDSCKTGAGIAIAFVDLDSVNANVDFIKNKKNELESEQKRIMSEYEAEYRRLESQRNELAKKGNAVTQQEAEEFDARIRQMEATKQQKGKDLAAKGASVMEDMQTKLKNFIKEYNRDERYAYIFATGNGIDNMLYKDSAQNITTDIVNGFNELLNKKRN